MWLFSRDHYTSYSKLKRQCCNQGLRSESNVELYQSKTRNCIRVKIKISLRIVEIQIVKNDTTGKAFNIPWFAFKLALFNWLLSSKFESILPVKFSFYLSSGRQMDKTSRDWILHEWKFIAKTNVSLCCGRISYLKNARGWAASI